LTIDVVEEVLSAEERIRSYIIETPLLVEGDVSFKLENRQHTGSFKVRGAMSKMRSLPSDMLAEGVVTASTGNHGAAVAYTARQLGVSAIVFVPEETPASKVAAIEELGAEIRWAGHDCVEAELAARGHGVDRGIAYIPPYNDPQVVGGQGTIGMELHRQAADTDALFVSLGGGGLISGIAGYLKSVRPDVEVIGCSPENSAVMIRSIEAGRILELPSLPTLSEGTAGGVEQGSITFDLCRELVDRYVTVTEEEIERDLKRFSRVHGMVIEGAAAVSISSYMRLRDEYRGRKAAVIICGGNLDPLLLDGI
jgi:threonine dehydratase